MPCAPCEPGTYSSGGGLCTKCADGTVTNPSQSTCTPTSSIQARKRNLGPPKDYCPEGLTACPIAGRQRVWECINTQTNIDSCGGCPGDGTGVDCTEFDNFATAACIKGKCSYGCPPNMNLTSTGCVLDVAKRAPKVARRAKRRHVVNNTLKERKRKRGL